MFVTILAGALALYFQIFDPLPLDMTLELNPEVEMSDSLEMLLEASDLAFTLESVTRHVSILGWASERYDLEVGEVLKSDLLEETVNLYVYPEGLYSSQFTALIEGNGVVICAVADSTHERMEGFRTDDGDWAVNQIYTF